MIDKETISKIDKILKEIIKNNSYLISDESNTTNIRFTTKQLDNYIDNNGEGWTKSKRILLFEFNNRSEYLDLKLIIGPGESSTREYLFELSNKNLLFNMHSTNLSEKWNSIYKIRIIDYEKIENFDIHFIKRVILEKIEIFFKGDLLQIESYFFKKYINNWTFFCNTKNWKIDTFLNDLNKGIISEIDTWRIRDSDKEKIKPGDYGLIRVGLDKRNKSELNEKND